MNKIICSAILCFLLAMQSFSQPHTDTTNIDSLFFQALEFQKAGKYSEALEIYLIAGNKTKQRRTVTELQQYLYSQIMACSCYPNLYEYDKGYFLAKELMEINFPEDYKGDVVHHFVVNGYLYGLNFLKNEQYSKAREIFMEIAPYLDGDMKNRVLPQISMTWFFEGAMHKLSQVYDKAKVCLKKSFDGFYELGDFENALSALVQLASISDCVYDMKGAISLYENALLLARQTKNASKEVEILRNLWNLNRQIGNVEAMHTQERMMDSLVETTAELEIKCEYYCQKGKEAINSGQSSLAEQWFLKAKATIEKIQPNKVVSCRHLVYTNLRDYYVRQEKYDEALIYGRMAIGEIRKLKVVDSTEDYLSYIKIADIYKLKGERGECFSCLDTLFMQEAKFKEPKERFRLYSTRAKYKAAFGDYETALKDYKKADEILASKYSAFDGDRVMLLPYMGGVEHKLGNYEESEHYYKQYVEGIRYIYGMQSVEYIRACIYLANAQGFAGHIKEGCNNYQFAVKVLKELIAKRLPYMTGSERESFWEAISPLCTDMTPYALKAELFQTEYTESCYDVLLMSKAFLLGTEQSLHHIVKTKGKEADMHNYMMIASMKEKLRLWEKNYAQNVDSIMKISQRINLLEAELTKACKAYGDMISNVNVSYADVKKTLGKNDILIDFTDFVTESAGRRYAAYIVSKKQEYPLLKALFSEDRIDSLGIVRPDLYYDKDFSAEVLKLLWDPFKEYVKEGATIYYVPSQLLFQISLESLSLPDGTLLGEHYNFVRLSSARELVKGKIQTTLQQASVKSAVLYGDLQYDLEPDIMVQEARNYDLSSLLIMRGDMVRGDSVFHELPGSKMEVEQIETTLRQSMFAVTSYTRMKGTEESFLNMHGKAPTILLLATHGFYYTPEKAVNIKYLKGYTDAMSLSGLVMSGGNAAWLGKELPKGVLGGILTANNISHIDLSGIEMVVLSACQSGQGKATSEGLYGLQRAFKKAGGGSVVMSLWNISDKVASEFMVQFFECLVAQENKWNKRKAFERAKSIIRQKYPDPFYWAAFVMLD